MITSTILVHSSEGVAFRVTTCAKTYEALQVAMTVERRYAESNTAAELDAHGDYARTGWGNIPFSYGGSVENLRKHCRERAWAEYNAACDRAAAGVK